RRRWQATSDDSARRYRLVRHRDSRRSGEMGRPDAASTRRGADAGGCRAHLRGRDRDPDTLERHAVRGGTRLTGFRPRLGPHVCVVADARDRTGFGVPAPTPPWLADVRSMASADGMAG